jgi:hypothetical protein
MGVVSAHRIVNWVNAARGWFLAKAGPHWGDFVFLRVEGRRQRDKSNWWLITCTYKIWTRRCGGLCLDNLLVRKNDTVQMCLYRVIWLGYKHVLVRTRNLLEINLRCIIKVCVINLITGWGYHDINRRCVRVAYLSLQRNLRRVLSIWLLDGVTVTIIGDISC